MSLEALSFMAFRQVLVRDFMSENPITVREDASLKDVGDLMTERGIRHLPVVDHEQKIVGLITQRDYLTVAISKLADVSKAELNEIYSLIKVRDVMAPDVLTVAPDERISGAARVMFERKFGCLPVVQNGHKGGAGKLVGILTEADFVKSMIGSETFIPKALRRLGAVSRGRFLKKRVSKS